MVAPKPCPICGGNEFGVAFDEVGKGEVAAYLSCESCDEDDDTEGPVAKAFDEWGAEEAAVRAWNHWVDSYRKHYSDMPLVLLRACREIMPIHLYEAPAGSDYKTPQPRSVQDTQPGR